MAFVFHFANAVRAFAFESSGAVAMRLSIFSLIVGTIWSKRVSTARSCVKSMVAPGELMIISRKAMASSLASESKAFNSSAASLNDVANKSRVASADGSLSCKRIWLSSRVSAPYCCACARIMSTYSNPARL